jgi:endonuclease G
VNIIQHLDGKSKKLTLRDKRLADILDDFLHYEADTEGGSFESPAFNEQWEVVSLHHAGIPKKDDQGNILTKSGTIWTPGMGESEIEWLFNEGVLRISRILANVGEQNLTTDEQKTLRDEIFTSRPPLP